MGKGGEGEFGGGLELVLRKIYEGRGGGGSILD